MNLILYLSEAVIPILVLLIVGNEQYQNRNDCI